MEKLEFSRTDGYEILSLMTECKQIKSLPIWVIYPRNDMDT